MAFNDLSIDHSENMMLEISDGEWGGFHIPFPKQNLPFTTNDQLIDLLIYHLRSTLIQHNFVEGMKKLKTKKWYVDEKDYIIEGEKWDRNKQDTLYICSVPSSDCSDEENLADFVFENTSEIEITDSQISHVNSWRSKKADTKKTWRSKKNE